MKLVTVSIILMFSLNLIGDSNGRKIQEKEEVYYCNNPDNCFTKEEFNAHLARPNFEDFLRNLPIIGDMTEDFKRMDSNKFNEMIRILTTELGKLLDNYDSVRQETIKTVFNPAKHLYEGYHENFFTNVNADEIKDSTRAFYQKTKKLNEEMDKDPAPRDYEIRFTEKTMKSIQKIFDDIE